MVNDMKELWIKKVAWQRHLIEDENVNEVKTIIKSLNQNNLETIIDLYDKNTKEEFDNILLFPVEGKKGMWRTYKGRENENNESENIKSTITSGESKHASG